MKNPHDTVDGKVLFHGGKSDRSVNREIKLTRVFIFFTLIASVLATIDVVGILLQHANAGSVGAVLEQSIFIFIVAFIV